MTFTTTEETLTSIEGSFFSALLSGKYNLDGCRDDHGCIFIDRDGERFRHILNYFRNHTLHLPRGGVNVMHIYEQVLEEARFFCITPLVDQLNKEIKEIHKENVRAVSSQFMAREGAVVATSPPPDKRRKISSEALQRMCSPNGSLRRSPRVPKFGEEAIEVNFDSFDSDF